MSQSSTGRWREVAGALGVIASLIFVGLEVRESSRATKSATDAEIASQFVAVNSLILESPELTAAFDAVRETGDPSEISPANQGLLLAFYRSLFHVWSNTHRQHLAGTVDPLLFESLVGEITESAGPVEPGSIDEYNIRRILIQWAWQGERYVYNTAFRTFVDSIMEAGQ